MKSVLKKVFPVLVILALIILAGCFNPLKPQKDWDGGETVVIVRLGESGSSRAVCFPEDELVYTAADFKYSVTFTNMATMGVIDAVIDISNNTVSARAVITPGVWTIDVLVELLVEPFGPYATGAITINVQQSEVVSIPMQRPSKVDFIWEEIPQDGSIEQPFLIYNLERWGKIGSGEEGWSLSMNYKQVTNLDLTESGAWTPIGAISPFTGSYDGGGLTIKGLTINSSGNNLGMFGQLEGGTVKNVKLENVTITGAGNNVGAVVGYNRGTVENCVALGAITGGDGVGAIVGRNDGTIRNAYSTADVTGNVNVGGIAGLVEGGLIANCYAIGTISASNYAGGIAGRVNGGTVENCAAINEAIKRTGGTAEDFGRVAGGNFARLENNAGWIYMTVINDGIVVSSDGASIDGMDLSTAGVKTRSTYEILGWEYGGEDQSPWKWGGATYPLPVLYWQKSGTYPADPEHLTTNEGGNEFEAGTGISGNPYVIADAAQLARLAELVNSGDTNFTHSYYRLGNDIDLSGYQNGAGWTPIGSSVTGRQFMGAFDGAGCVVRNLKINKPESLLTNNYQGLFGYINDAAIKNLGVENCEILAYNYAGGLAGYVTGNSTIINCYVIGGASGVINGSGNTIGGLVGYAGGEFIENSYAAVNVIGSSDIVGGLIGRLDSGYLLHSYTTGAVSGRDSVGGLVGHLESGSVEYSAAINTSITRTGGTGTNFGRVAGLARGTLVTNSAWSGMEALGGAVFGAAGASNKDGRDVITADAITQGAYTSLGFEWGATDQLPWKWGGLAYPLPVLYWQDPGMYPTMPEQFSKDSSGNFDSGLGTINYPYLIKTPAHLVNLTTLINATGNADYRSAYYRLENDIDLSAYQYGEGWTPIGSSATNSFRGNFDGNGYAVRNLTIARSTADNQGLFGFATNNAVIRNLGVEGVNINARDNVGGLVGNTSATVTISNCYVTGALVAGNLMGVSGRNNVGGLSGYTAATTIENCSAGCPVTGTGTPVGGLVGHLYGTSAIRNSYASGNVSSSSSDVGGLVGHSSYTNTIEWCYASGNVSGTTAVGGLLGAYSSTVPTIRGCVAANARVAATSETGTVNRITPVGTTYVNNHAYSGMIVTRFNNLVTVTGTLTDGAGAGKTLAELTNFAFYSNPGNWFNVWDISAAEDSARIWRIIDNVTMPFHQTQKEVNSDYVIAVATGGNGTVTPSGHVRAASGSNQNFTITPAQYYEVDSLLVDGEAKTIAAAGGTYTLSGVAANSSIHVMYKIAGFAGGNGAEDTPYEISTPANLTALASFVNSGSSRGNHTATKYFTLTGNIDFAGILTTEGWAPIGNATTGNQFRGNFDGDGYAVRNLSIARSSSSYQGLFGATTNGAVIRNLGVESVNILGYDSVGGLVGNATNTTITNCYVSGVATVSGRTSVGGLAGYISGSTIERSYSSTNVSGTGTAIGGLAGDCYNSAVIRNCYATGNVSSTSSSVGGLVGYLNSNSGNIVEYCYASGNVSGTTGVGGLIGSNGSGITVRNNIAANARVSATNEDGLLFRITGTSGTYVTNHALDDMYVLRFSNLVESTDNTNNAAGQGRPLADLTSLAFYTTPGNWNSLWNIAAGADSSYVWGINPGSLPFLQWQKTVNTDHTIIAAYGGNGTIVPSGHVRKAAGTSQDFTITPNQYYVVDKLWVDDVETALGPLVGGSHTHTLSGVGANMSIRVTFKFGGFAGGNGTLATPYEIDSPASLATMATFVNAGRGIATIGKYFVLTSDIDLISYQTGEGWIPIGRDGTGNQFRGNFDGDGHVVSNIRIVRATVSYQGLFGAVATSGAVIKNLGVENVSISSYDRVGGLVGDVSGGVVINNCYVGYNNSMSISGRSSVGGLAGYVTGSTIERSYSSTNVSGTGTSIGGLAGDCYNSAVIRNCYATGNVSSTSSSVGGLVGYLNPNSTNIVEYCYASGNVSGTTGVGGLIGSNSSGTFRNNIAANARVSATSNGGVVFRIIGTSGTYQNNYAYEDMIVTSFSNLVTGVDNTNSAWGQGKAFASFGDIAFYTDNSASVWYSLWDIVSGRDSSRVWGVNPGALPFLQWQDTLDTDHVIIAASGGYGSISPLGHVRVTTGGSLSFTITPNSLYVVDKLLVNGVDTAIASTGGVHTISSISANGSIRVTFKIDGFSGGNGTQATPYLIADANELRNLGMFVETGTNGNATAGYYFKLTGNIDLTGYMTIPGWTPIGNSTTGRSFQGIFDGDGKTVSKLYINRPAAVAASDDQGLFGYISGATIRNVGVIDCDIIARNSVGGLVGYGTGAIIENCYVTGEISAGGNVGGLIGYFYSGEISNCYAACPITATATRAGGFAGDLRGTVRNSYATGNVSSTNIEVGGFAGYTYGGTIEFCYATGTVRGTNTVGGLSGGGSGPTFRNNAALNELIYTTTTSTGINRISGINGTFSNNHAFSGMLVRTNTSNDITVTPNITTQAGQNLSATTIKTDGTLGGLFVTANGWTVQNGRLPGLFGNTVDMPDYIE